MMRKRVWDPAEGNRENIGFESYARVVVMLGNTDEGPTDLPFSLSAVLAQLIQDR